MEKTLDQIMDEYIKASEAFGQSLTDEQRKKPETIAFVTVQVDIIEALVRLREIVIDQDKRLKYSGVPAVEDAEWAK